MKFKLLIVGVLISSILFGQTSKPFVFREIGWTIKLPNDFKLDDSTLIARETEDGTVILENASNIKLDMVKTKNLISASKDLLNRFNVTLSKSTAPSLHYWDSINNRVIGIFYNAMVKEAPEAKFDSSRTTEIIDGVSFKSFKIDIKVSDVVTVHNYMMTKLYKNFTFTINFLYTDEVAGEEIKKMIRESRLSK